MHMDNEWLIVCSQSLKYYVHCICGHRVKRITYLYHKQSKAIQYVGKTCVRKYGIEMSLTNPILLEVIKANLSKAEWDRDACVREHIQSQYTTFMTMAKEEDTIAYSVVGPFRRLLSDVCDLVSEFNYDLVDVLRDIEREVESLNQTTRHQMVDEYSLCDSISEIASEHSDTELSERNMEDAEAEEPGVIGVILEEMVTDIVVETGLKEIGVPALINQPESMIDKFVRTTTIDDQDTCSATAHCYCGMKYRLRRLQEGINELRQTIEDNRKEAQELIEQSREQREKAKEYLERSRKQHPELFSEDEDKDEDKDEKKN